MLISRDYLRLSPFGQFSADLSTARTSSHISTIPPCILCYRLRCNAKSCRHRARSSDTLGSWYILRHLLSGTQNLYVAGVRRTWKHLLDGQCGIRFLDDHESLDTTNQQWALQDCRVAGLVPRGKHPNNGGWKASEWLSRDVGRCRRVLASMGRKFTDTRMSDECQSLCSMQWLPPPKR